MEKLLERILTREWLECFEIGEVKETILGKYPEENELMIELREKKERIPTDIPDGARLESKGFCDPLELIDHPLGGQPTYIKFYRRRWRCIESKQEYHNHYDLRFPGTKLTHRFANFLKAKDRKGEIAEFFDLQPHLWDLIQEDLPVVQITYVRIRSPWHKRIFRRTR